MDFTETLSLYGWDAEKAHEAVKDVPPVDYPSDVIDKEMERVGLETISK